jgi:hypothetical protein
LITAVIIPEFLFTSEGFVGEKDNFNAFVLPKNVCIPTLQFSPDDNNTGKETYCRVSLLRRPPGATEPQKVPGNACKAIVSVKENNNFNNNNNNKNNNRAQPDNACRIAPCESSIAPSSSPKKRNPKHSQSPNPKP